MKTCSLIIGLMVVFAANLYAQTWQFTGSLNTARHCGTINALDNGQVLVTGGDDKNGNALASCELYDPATAAWSYTAPMKLPRERQTSTELPDGRVVVIGGNTANVYQSDPTAAIEIYDPSTNTWSDGGALQLQRQNHTATLLNDSLILVCAGYTGSEITNECEIYDLNSHKSTVVQPMILARHDQAAVLLSDGRVLVAGGRTGGSVSDYLSECEIYDPSSNTWAVAPSMAQPREYGLMMRFSDNTVIAAGGRSSIKSTAPGAEIFDPSNPGWTSVSPMLQPCHWPGATVLPQDRLLMTGGITSFDWSDASGQTMTNTATCEWYDKQNQKWFYAPTMNDTRAQQGAIFLDQTVNPDLPAEMVLVAGGMIGSSNATSTCEVLDVGSSALSYYMHHQQQAASVPCSSSANGLSITYESSVPSAMLSLSADEQVETQLASTDGRVVYQDTKQLSSGQHRLILPQGLVPGMYLLRVSFDARTISTKILIR